MSADIRQVVFATIVCALLACRVSAQEPQFALPDEADAAVPADAGRSSPGTIGRFVGDVLGDYKHFFRPETAIWLGTGGAAALAVHQADQSIADSAQANPPSLPGGSVWGSQYFQVPLAVGWWALGAAAGSSTQADAGRDLLRAQISVASWTYGIKLVADRTRPNGQPHSFPSGHASTSFTTAMVLQEHFGWKVGLPAFVAAAYTAASRVADNQHWTSDVVFGAALGIASARTVTLHIRDTRFSVAPVAVPRGAAIAITALN